MLKKKNTKALKPKKVMAATTKVAESSGRAEIDRLIVVYLNQWKNRNHLSLGDFNEYLASEDIGMPPTLI